MKKLFFILTVAVMTILTACDGAFVDPGLMDVYGGGDFMAGNGSGGININFDNTCLVIFEISTNGGSGTAPSSLVVPRGSTIVLPDGSGFSKADYNFKGWSKNPAAGSFGTEPIYLPGNSYKIGKDDPAIIFFAIFEIQ